MIDAQGFRAKVGIILVNDRGQAFWGRRIGMSEWQFPQGGVNPEESLEEAVFRELREEVGLEPQHVEIIGWTRRWLRYRLPRRYIRYDQKPLCIGQKQRWYVLRLITDDTQVDLRLDAEPEFEQWRWIDYWDALQEVVDFKRGVYQQALNELAPLIEQFCSVTLTRRAP